MDIGPEFFCVREFFAGLFGILLQNSEMVQNRQRANFSD